MYVHICKYMYVCTYTGFLLMDRMISLASTLPLGWSSKKRKNHPSNNCLFLLPGLFFLSFLGRRSTRWTQDDGHQSMQHRMTPGWGQDHAKTTSRMAPGSSADDRIIADTWATMTNMQTNVLLASCKSRNQDDIRMIDFWCKSALRGARLTSCHDNARMILGWWDFQIRWAPISIMISFCLLDLAYEYPLI